MARILVAFATTDGHTAIIARRIGEVLKGEGHAVEVVRVQERRDLPLDVDAVIFGGSVHYGRHQRALSEFVVVHEEELEAMPTAFFSVSLSQEHADGKREAARYVRDFIASCGFVPEQSEPFAGALLYTQYNPLKRWMMKRLAIRTGGPTDTSRDYEFTDWNAVEAFARRFSESLREAPPPGPIPPAPELHPTT